MCIDPYRWRATGRPCKKDSLFVDFLHCSATVSLMTTMTAGKWSCIDGNPGQEGSPLIEIDGGSDIRAVAFAANGEQIVGGGDEKGVGVWRVEDGKKMATMPASDYVYCLAVSEDGRWIAGGTY